MYGDFEVESVGVNNNSKSDQQQHHHHHHLFGEFTNETKPKEPKEVIVDTTAAKELSKKLPKGYAYEPVIPIATPTSTTTQPTSETPSKRQRKIVNSEFLNTDQVFVGSSGGFIVAQPSQQQQQEQQQQQQEQQPPLQSASSSEFDVSNLTQQQQQQEQQQLPALVQPQSPTLPYHYLPQYPIKEKKIKQPKPPKLPKEKKVKQPKPAMAFAGKKGQYKALKKLLKLELSQIDSQVAMISQAIELGETFDNDSLFSTPTPVQIPAYIFAVTIQPPPYVEQQTQSQAPQQLDSKPDVMEIQQTNEQIQQHKTTITNSKKYENGMSKKMKKVNYSWNIII